MKRAAGGLLRQLVRIRSVALAALLAGALVALPACSDSAPGAGSAANLAHLEAATSAPQEPGAAESVRIDAGAGTSISTEGDDASAAVTGLSTVVGSGAETSDAFLDADEVPAYTGSPYTTVNGNVLDLTEEELPLVERVVRTPRRTHRPGLRPLRQLQPLSPAPASAAH